VLENGGFVVFNVTKVTKEKIFGMEFWLCVVLSPAFWIV
jgi:hypothetical protein